MRQARAALRAQTRQSKEAMEQQTAHAMAALALQERQEAAAHPHLEVILRVSVTINIGASIEHFYSVAVTNEGGADAAVVDVGLRADGYSDLSVIRLPGSAAAGSVRPSSASADR